MNKLTHNNMSQEYKFNPRKIVKETIAANKQIYGTRQRKPIKESATIDYSFVDDKDFQETMAQYVYWVYQYDEIFHQFDNLVHDIVWSTSIPTIDAFDTEERESWVILFNPTFAKLLLDERLKTVDHIDYDEHNDKWPVDYFRLFYCAILYASVLAKTKSEIPENDLNRLSQAPKTAFNNMRSSYNTEFPDVIGILEKLLAQYSPKF